MSEHTHEHESHEHPSWWRTRSGVVMALFLAAVGFFLWTEHRAHLLGALPYLILLACPLMHLFHHGGHRHGDRSRSSESQPPRGDRS
jgi:hypothetical protein